MVRRDGQKDCITKTRTENLRDFTAIRAQAFGNLSIRRGGDYDVLVIARRGTADDVTVRKEGATLVLEERRGGFGIRPGRYSATITMPAISALDCSGVGDVTISGFTGPGFRLTSSGMGAISCRDSSFENLAVTLSGTGSVDFANAQTKNADVSLSGLGSLKLHMAGGELRGELSGLGSIEYTGTVTAERITKSGLGAVVRK